MYDKDWNDDRRELELESKCRWFQVTVEQWVLCHSAQLGWDSSRTYQMKIVHVTREPKAV